MTNQPAPMRDELLPCPFCGGTNIGEEYIQTFSTDSSYDTFGCKDCGANFKDGSRKEWNRRALAERAGGVADGPFAYCRACQAVGMSNCSNFDECSGATCITCHRPLNIAAPSPVSHAVADGWRLLRLSLNHVNGPEIKLSSPNEQFSVTASLHAGGRETTLYRFFDAMLTAAPSPDAQHGVQGVVKCEFQPIHTAPKDRLICVWITNKPVNGRQWGEQPEFWAYCYYDQICGEWRTTRPSGHLRCVPERYVTHWMDIPTPQPSQPANNEGDSDGRLR